MPNKLYEYNYASGSYFEVDYTRADIEELEEEYEQMKAALNAEIGQRESVEEQLAEACNELSKAMRLLRYWLTAFRTGDIQHATLNGRGHTALRETEQFLNED